MLTQCQRQNVLACSAHSRLCAENTSKIRAIRQLGVVAALGQDADDAVLDEIHLLADGPLSDDVVSRLEDLEVQFGQHGGDKVRIGVCEKRHGGHQFATVKVDDLLQKTPNSVLDIKARPSHHKWQYK